jgi:ubiquinone/menaquinone biosynthesis C-methylase UbiE
MSQPKDLNLQRAYASFRSLHYLRHNQRRQEHLATLGLDLRNQTVLEVGAGIGDHTTFFLDQGCKVVSLEARLENCQFFAESFKSSGYRSEMDLELIRSDVEHMAEHVTGQFDVVYCYGLLYHLKDPVSALKLMAERCRKLFLLETCVSFSAEEAVNPVTEPKEKSSQSYHGQGCRPTRPWVFKELKTLFAHVYVPRTQPAHEEFPTTWQGVPPPNLRTRAVFVASRAALDNRSLLDCLPDTQDPCS